MFCTGRTRRRGTGLTSRPRRAGTFRRTVRSFFPHRATARWGPKCGPPPTAAHRHAQHLSHSFLFAPTHIFSVRAGHPAGPPYNLRKPTPQRRTGRRPRRPTVLRNIFPISFCSPQRTIFLYGPDTRPARLTIYENLPHNAVRAAAHGGPTSYAISSPYFFIRPNAHFSRTGRTPGRPALQFTKTYPTTLYGPPPTAAHRISGKLSHKL